MAERSVYLYINGELEWCPPIASVNLIKGGTCSVFVANDLALGALPDASSSDSFNLFYTAVHTLHNTIHTSPVHTSQHHWVFSLNTTVRSL